MTFAKAGFGRMPFAAAFRFLPRRTLADRTLLYDTLTRTVGESVWSTPALSRSVLTICTSSSSR